MQICNEKQSSQYEHNPYWSLIFEKKIHLIRGTALWIYEQNGIA